ncbi:MAG: hypothetical protein OXI54_07600 [Chloroflexota bacterium]|nr:hypothetical protein [Chloroflexota bacterium]MDE2683997.1 hypothetical protein [Chloroflexota bacterium]
MEQENNVRRGYPWWAWVIGALWGFPLVPMLIGVVIPKTRRYLGAPGIILSSIAIIGVIAIIGALVGDSEEAETSTTTPTAQTVSRTQFQAQQTRATARQPVQNEQVRPTPAATSPCRTAAGRAYLEAVVALPIGDSLLTMGALSSQAADNPLLLNDETWRLETAVGLGAMLYYAEELEALTPPDSLLSVHADALLMAEELRAFVRYYGAGVDSLDESLIIQSGIHLAAIGNLANTMADKVDAVCP